MPSRSRLWIFPDDDNDVDDDRDAFPLDPNESLDTDIDGIGNNADPDDDNDNVEDSGCLPARSLNESLDTDGDGRQFADR